MDGATSTALQVDFLRQAGLDPMFHIPTDFRRLWAHIGAIEQLAAQGVRLLVTVDCGTTSIETLAAAKALGLDVVVLDHHQAASIFPTSPPW